MRPFTFDVPEELSSSKLVAFARCYQLETWLRELVYLETKSSFGSGYWDECKAALDRADWHGISPERSIAADQRHPHMATAENDPLWFISFDCLTKLVLDEALWPLFAPYLTTKKLVDAKFDEVKVVRNRIAHARSLHSDDVERLLRVMKDLDPGLWKFCASYGDEYRNDDDAVLKNFSSGTRGSLDVDASIVIRSSISCTERSSTKRGMLYKFRFSTTRHRRFLDYEGILRATLRLHKRVAHIMLDAYQDFLVVTIPAVEGVATVIETGESFGEVCGNCTTFSNTESILFSRSNSDSESPGIANPQRYEALLEAFDELASGWPHYVVPPRHAFTILNSHRPCSLLQL